jgi:CubicO group peptidase (beta-lactamase class C family)
MKKIMLQTVKGVARKFTLCIFSVVLFHSFATLSAQTQKYFTASGKKISIGSFNEEIERMLDETGIPALSLAVIDNNKVVFSNAYGYKQLKKKDRVNEKTVFEACSLSKIYLVYVVQKLVDEGLFDLDKPMYQYLEYEPLQHDPRYKLITPRMILSHCSGIENWKSYNNKDTLEIISNPGEKFVYSGEGFQYLAKVIALVLHKPYETYINEMVTKSLHLKTTFFKYTSQQSNPKHPESPSNYAIGHDNFGGEINKWKNFEAVPASGVHTVASEFAELLISIFDKKNLSDNRIKNMLQPVVGLIDNNTSFYMGSGFFTIYGNNDTIVSFSGNNDGFKAEMLYSVVNRKGFVFFTNSDRGSLITKKLCEMSARLNMNPLFYDQGYNEQYPSAAFSLLKIYREKNADAMFNEIEKFITAGKIDVNTLNELGDLFMARDKSVSRKLLEKNVSLYPDSSDAYGLLGRVYYDTNEYELAYKSFSKAKELQFDLWDVDNDIKECRNKINTGKK